jgi:hypothetical protein
MSLTKIITLFILKRKDGGLTWAAPVPSSNVCENAANRQLQYQHLLRQKSVKYEYSV